MKVLVTGGSGFLGINLIRFLRAKGVEEVRVIDIADFDYPEKSEPWLKFTLGDVRDAAAVDKITEGCDIVINTAAALPLAQRTFDVPVIGVIAPGARAAIQARTFRRIGVIATPLTVQSRA